MNRHNYTMSHREVKKMVRDFLVNRGYKVIYHNDHAFSCDDTFLAPNGEEIICEYKPTPISKTEVMGGFGQAFVYSADTGLRCYLTLGELEYNKFTTAINKAPWLGLFVYDDNKIKHWRRPVDIGLLPKPNEVQEV